MMHSIRKLKKRFFFFFFFPVSLLNFFELCIDLDIHAQMGKEVIMIQFMVIYLKLLLVNIWIAER